jgi:Lon protease-like protein
VSRVPLFPLRTVLFPGGGLPLKIFEQRYSDMTKACLRDDQPFGVCLITRGEEVGRDGGAAPEFAAVGTLAQIVNFDMPQLGILHVSTTGLGRFRVESHAVTPSGLATGEIVPIPPEPSLALPEKHAQLARLLEAIAARVGPDGFPAAPRYDDASWVGYRLAELLPLPLSIKQSMLEINDAGIRLDALAQALAKQGLV